VTRCAILGRRIRRATGCRGCSPRQRQGHPGDAQYRYGFLATSSLRSVLHMRHGTILLYLPANVRQKGPAANVSGLQHSFAAVSVCILLNAFETNLGVSYLKFSCLPARAKRPSESERSPKLQPGGRPLSLRPLEKWATLSYPIIAAPVRL
jgi:hypothetical protein